MATSFCFSSARLYGFHTYLVFPAKSRSDSVPLHQ